MASIRFANPAGVTLNDVEVRHLADLLERQRAIPAQTAASKLMEAVALPRRPPQPVALNRRELLALRDLLREQGSNDGASLGQLRAALELLA